MERPIDPTEAQDILSRARQIIGDGGEVPPELARMIQALDRMVEHRQRIADRRAGRPVMPPRPFVSAAPATQAAEAAPPAPARPRCAHATLLDEPYHPARPCKGAAVACDHPQGPARWYVRGCNPQKCRFYEAG